MKKIVLKVVKQCVGTDGVEPDYIRTEVSAVDGLGWTGNRGPSLLGRPMGAS